MDAAIGNDTAGGVTALMVAVMDLVLWLVGHWWLLAGIVAAGSVVYAMVVRRLADGASKQRAAVVLEPSRRFDPGHEEIFRYGLQLMSAAASGPWWVPGRAKTVRIRIGADGVTPLSYRVEGPAGAAALLRTTPYGGAVVCEPAAGSTARPVEHAATAVHKRVPEKQWRATPPPPPDTTPGCHDGVPPEHKTAAAAQHDAASLDHGIAAAAQRDAAPVKRGVAAAAAQGDAVPLGHEAAAAVQRDAAPERYEPAAAKRGKGASPREVARAEFVLRGRSSALLRDVPLEPDPLQPIVDAVADLRADLGDTAEICLDLQRAPHWQLKAPGRRVPKQGWARRAQRRASARHRRYRSQAERPRGRPPCSPGPHRSGPEYTPRRRRTTEPPAGAGGRAGWASRP